MTSPTESTLTRTPHRGSCHCGHITYILYLTLPSTNHPELKFPLPPTATKIYKCNCRTCHKMSYLHVRPPSPVSDFILLSPLLDDSGSAEGLSEYRCNAGYARWHFCGRCGVRCFTITGAEGGRVGEVDLGAVFGRHGGEGKGEREGGKVSGWRPGEGVKYLSVNVVTLDQGGEVDLREWSEKGWIGYLDKYGNGGKGKWELERPGVGGTY